MNMVHFEKKERMIEMNENQKYFEHVVKSLDKRSVLEHLAEESSEVTKEALKVIRAEKLSVNTTPITREDAINKLIEEINDVRMIISMLKHKYPELDEALPKDNDIINNPKWKRWAHRLGYVE